MAKAVALVREHKTLENVFAHLRSKNLIPKDAFVRMDSAGVSRTTKYFEVEVNVMKVRDVCVVKAFVFIYISSSFSHCNQYL